MTRNFGVIVTGGGGGGGCGWHDFLHCAMHCPSDVFGTDNCPQKAGQVSPAQACFSEFVCAGTAPEKQISERSNAAKGQPR
jgi:hypothetical protein